MDEHLSYNSWRPRQGNTVDFLGPVSIAEVKLPEKMSMSLDGVEWTQAHIGRIVLDADAFPVVVNHCVQRILLFTTTDKRSMILTDADNLRTLQEGTVEDMKTRADRLVLTAEVVFHLAYLAWHHVGAGQFPQFLGHDEELQQGVQHLLIMYIWLAPGQNRL